KSAGIRLADAEHWSEPSTRWKGHICPVVRLVILTLCLLLIKKKLILCMGHEGGIDGNPLIQWMHLAKTLRKKCFSNDSSSFRVAIFNALVNHHIQLLPYLRLHISGLLQAFERDGQSFYRG